MITSLTLLTYYIACSFNITHNTAGLFNKGEQAAEDVKHEGKKAASDAERSAQEGKEEAKGIFGGVYTRTSLHNASYTCLSTA
jgi:hypothetical protein